MKNPSFRALHNPFPSQSEMQGRKPKEEIQQLAFSHTMRNHKRQPKNFAHYAKFRMVCEIFLCTDSIRFLSPDILYNLLFSPCNQPRYFLLYLFIYLLGRLHIKGETEGEKDIMLCMFFIRHL